MLKNLFGRLFGASATAPAAPTVEPVAYQGYLIYPEPKAEGSQFRLAGRITRQREDEILSHTFIRADLLPSAEQAEELMVDKAKRLIDQLGDALFAPPKQEHD